MAEFYDLCLRAPEAMEKAGELGFSGVGIILGFEKGVFEKISSLRKSLGKPAAFGVEIKAGVKSKAKDIRKNVELIAGEGRPALETNEVDIAFCEEVDYVMARIAKRNNVAIAFSLHPIIHSSKRGRGELLSRYFNAAKLIRKYKAPFLLTSGAVSKWDLRGPSDLIAFGKVLGFNQKDCERALSGRILKENRKRLGGKWIIPGVEAEV